MTINYEMYENETEFAPSARKESMDSALEERIGAFLARELGATALGES